jgi:hypothetical protein
MLGATTSAAPKASGQIGDMSQVVNLVTDSRAIAPASQTQNAPTLVEGETPMAHSVRQSPMSPRRGDSYRQRPWQLQGLTAVGLDDLGEASAVSGHANREGGAGRR